MGGHPVVYSVFNTQQYNIYIYRYTRNKLTEAETSKLTKKTERRLKQSTNSYKIHCGVEKNKCVVFQKKQSLLLFIRRVQGVLRSFIIAY